MNMRGILVITLFILSCSPSVPEDILPPEKMKVVMWDVLRADEMAAYYLSVDTSVNRLQAYIGYYQNILNIHNISREKFKKSLTYYQNHPVLFKVVLDSLQNYADRQQKKSDSSLWKPAQPVTIPQHLPLTADSFKKRRPK